MTDITMNLNDTLELDAIIEEWKDSNKVLDLNGDGSSFNISGIQTKTSILDPQETGNYTITINGQDLSVEVTGSNTTPDGTIHQWKLNKNSGDPSDSVGNIDLNFNSNNWVPDSNSVGGYKVEIQGSNPMTTEQGIDKVTKASDYSIFLTIEQSSYNSGGLISNTNNGDDGDKLTITLESENVHGGIRTDGTNFTDKEGYSSGSKQRVCLRYDSSNSEFQILVNGNNNTTTTANPRSSGNNLDQLNIGSEPDETNVINNTYFDNILIVDRYVTDSEVSDDYSTQPWS